MDALDALSARAHYAGALLLTRTADGESSEDDHENDISRVTRLLELVKLLLATIATALTIARMLGWL